MLPLLTLIAQSDGNLGGPFTGLSGYEAGATIEASATTLELLVGNVVGFLTIAAGVSFLIYFSLGGLTWITANGDPGKIDEAKSRMTNGAVGMIIIVAAWSIVWIVGEVLGLDILNLQETLPKIGPTTAPPNSLGPNTPPIPRLREFPF